MGATTTFGWPFPNLSDPANGPAAYQALGQAAENTVKDSTILTYTPSWTSEGSVQPSGPASNIGYYRVDNGICRVAIRLTGGPGTSGGTGNLSLSVPLPPNTTIARQFLPLYYVIGGAGGGIYMGFGSLANYLGTTMLVYLPATAADVRLGRWCNATEGNGTGTGIPVVPGWYGMVDGSEMVVQGFYYL